MYRKTFSGGVHPADGKELARDVPFRPCPAGGEMVFPLSQHIGKPAKPVVQKGDKVLAGQIIAAADGFVSANIHSSVSGTVKAVENRVNVTGTPAPAIIIENDGQNTPAPGVGKEAKPSKPSREQILKAVQDAGIVGMGGAGFPTHVKLAPRNPEDIQFILVNGAECEPYITCDDQLMRAWPDETAAGLELMLSLFPHAQGVFVIEDNKPEAIAAMTAACQKRERMEVHAVRTKYPQGGERSIISVITGRHLKLGMLPADLGCIVENVGTVRAIYRAVCRSEPLMERGFTVSGDGVREPCNLIVKVGTKFEDVLAAAGGFAEGEPPQKLICGGPMMGFAMTSLEAGVCKNNNALTVFREDPVALAERQQTACLRCGRCNQVCPLGLTPQMMAVVVERRDFGRFEKKLCGMECVACGTCTYICPAKRPLTQLFKQAKAEVAAAKRKGATA